MSKTLPSFHKTRLMAEKKDTQLAPLGEIQAGYVLLPFDEGQFKDFIKSLLGSPQAISRRIPGAFEIELADLRNLYSLILQRVTQQNSGVLAQFTAKVVYSDNSTIELASIEELLTYNEIRPVVSRAVHLKWDFVVRFPDKAVPEKQRIQVSFVSSADALTVIDEQIPPIGRILVHSTEGYAMFRVEHTARTWGADLEAMLTSHINSLLRQPNPLKKFVRDHSGKISFGVAATFFLSTLIVAFGTTRRFARIQVSEVQHLIQAPASTSTHKLDYLATFVAGGAWSQYYFAVFVFLIIALILSFVFAAWVEGTANNSEPSFVLLTKEARKERQKTLERMKRTWVSFVVALLFSIATGVIGNIVFARWFT